MNSQTPFVSWYPESQVMLGYHPSPIDCIQYSIKTTNRGYHLNPSIAVFARRQCQSVEIICSEAEVDGKVD